MNGFFFLAAALAQTEPMPIGHTIRTEAVRQAEQFSVPSVVIVVVHNGQTIFKDVVHPERMPDGVKITSAFDTQTLLPIGSCTKAFTSSAIASLVADRTMNWDDRVVQHRPNFHLSDPDADRLVTIRDLLSHRTGLAGHDLLWYRSGLSLESSIGRLNHLPLAGPFRKSFHYSSLTVAAAGQAAAKTAKQSWPDLIRDRVAQPAKIERIAFTTAQAKSLGTVATGWKKTESGTLTAMPEFEMTEANPAGSIFLDAKGLESWLKFLVDPAQKKWLSEPWTPQIEIPLSDTIRPFHPDSRRLSYGMGWLISEEPRPVMLHGGMIDGIRTQILVDPENRLGIALVNDLHDSMLNVSLAMTIKDMVMGRPKRDHASSILAVVRSDEAKLKEHRAELKRLKAKHAKSKWPLLPYVGTYTNAGYGEGRITLRDGRLTWTWGKLIVPLDRVGDHAFAMTIDPVADRLIEFEWKDGEVKGLTFAEQSFRK